jgi:hypothetical protein
MNKTTRVIIKFSSNHREDGQNIRIIESFMNLVGGKQVIDISTEGDKAYPRTILTYDIPRRDNDDFGPLVFEFGIDSLKYILG